MDPTASFRVRRVLVGVVAGLTLLSLAFYGWVQYRQSQYHDRERGVLTRFHQDYTLCVTAGNSALGCATRVVAACVDDPFWQLAKPFSFDAAVAKPDALASCRDGVVAG